MSDFDERLERYIAGDMAGAERVSFEDEVLANPELADRLYNDASLVAAIETAARARRQNAVDGASDAPWWRRPMLRWLAPAAAVAAVFVVMVVMRPSAPDEGPVFRGEDVSLEGYAPQGDVSDVPAEFTWAAVEGASFYRFELFDSASVLVFTTTTDDTRLALPAQTSAPASGYWTLTPAQRPPRVLRRKPRDSLSLHPLMHALYFCNHL